MQKTRSQNPISRTHSFINRTPHTVLTIQNKSSWEAVVGVMERAVVGQGCSARNKEKEKEKEKDKEKGKENKDKEGKDKEGKEKDKECNVRCIRIQQCCLQTNVNPIHQFPPQIHQNLLQTLTKLHITKCNLKALNIPTPSPSPTLPTPFPCLQQLNLSQNSLTSIPEFVYACPSLSKIILNANMIGRIDGRLAGMRELRRVEIGGNRVREVSVAVVLSGWGEGQEGGGGVRVEWEWNMEIFRLYVDTMLKSKHTQSVQTNIHNTQKLDTSIFPTYRQKHPLSHSLSFSINQTDQIASQAPISPTLTNQTKKPLKPTHPELLLELQQQYLCVEQVIKRMYRLQTGTVTNEHSSTCKGYLEANLMKEQAEILLFSENILYLRFVQGYLVRLGVEVVKRYIGVCLEERYYASMDYLLQILQYIDKIDKMNAKTQNKTQQLNQTPQNAPATTKPLIFQDIDLQLQIINPTKTTSTKKPHKKFQFLPSSSNNNNKQKTVSQNDNTQDINPDHDHLENIVMVGRKQIKMLAPCKPNKPKISAFSSKYGVKSKVLRLDGDGDGEDKQGSQSQRERQEWKVGGSDMKEYLSDRNMEQRSRNDEEFQGRNQSANSYHHSKTHSHHPNQPPKQITPTKPNPLLGKQCQIPPLTPPPPPPVSTPHTTNPITPHQLTLAKLSTYNIEHYRTIPLEHVSLVSMDQFIWLMNQLEYVGVGGGGQSEGKRRGYGSGSGMDLGRLRKVFGCETMRILANTLLTDQPSLQHLLNRLTHKPSLSHLLQSTTLTFLNTYHFQSLCVMRNILRLEDFRLFDFLYAKYERFGRVLFGGSGGVVVVGAVGAAGGDRGKMEYLVGKAKLTSSITMDHPNQIKDKDNYNTVKITPLLNNPSTISNKNYSTKSLKATLTAPPHPPPHPHINWKQLLPPRSKLYKYLYKHQKQYLKAHLVENECQNKTYHFPEYVPLRGAQVVALESQQRRGWERERGLREYELFQGWYRVGEGGVEGQGLKQKEMGKEIDSQQIVAKQNININKNSSYSLAKRIYMQVLEQCEGGIRNIGGSKSKSRQAHGGTASSSSAVNRSQIFESTRNDQKQINMSIMYPNKSISNINELNLCTYQPKAFQTHTINRQNNKSLDRFKFPKQITIPQFSHSHSNLTPNLHKIQQQQHRHKPRPHLKHLHLDLYSTKNIPANKQTTDTDPVDLNVKSLQKTKIEVTQLLSGKKQKKNSIQIVCGRKVEDCGDGGDSGGLKRGSRRLGISVYSNSESNVTPKNIQLDNRLKLFKNSSQYNTIQSSKKSMPNLLQKQILHSQNQNSYKKIRNQGQKTQKKILFLDIDQKPRAKQEEKENKKPDTKSKALAKDMNIYKNINKISIDEINMNINLKQRQNHMDSNKSSKQIPSSISKNTQSSACLAVNTTWSNNNNYNKAKNSEQARTYQNYRKAKNIGYSSSNSNKNSNKNSNNTSSVGVDKISSLSNRSQVRIVNFSNLSNLSNMSGKYIKSNSNKLKLNSNAYGKNNDDCNCNYNEDGDLFGEVQCSTFDCV